MNLTEYLLSIKIHLIQTHSNILMWFEEDEVIKVYRPQNNGWTISEILEHISLTSHYLLILIDKAVNKALKNVQNRDLPTEINSANFELDRLNRIGIHQSFKWQRPDHMVPKGEKSESEVKSELISHLSRCLNYLDNLRNGEGLLYRTTMTVDELGKLDVYEYIYFLSKHAERHIGQMSKNKKEFYN